jgi:hypothetical protein
MSFPSLPSRLKRRGVTIRRQVQLPSLAMLALLMALLLRAAIPAGYMLAPVDGEPRIVPCSGIAPAISHHGGHHHGPGTEVPCAFALVAPPALPDVPPLLAPPPPLPALAPPPAAGAIAPYSRIAFLPPATGPPAA